MGNVYIYALADPRTKQIRYIGQTSNLKQRLALHISRNSQRRDEYSEPRSRWVGDLVSNGLEPVITIVEVVSKDKAAERESFWIEHYLRLGCDLTNVVGTKINGESYVMISLHKGTRRRLQKAIRLRSKETGHRWTYNDFVASLLDLANAPSIEEIKYRENAR